tara:strand:+ start:15922 stop:16854 length:933 start_codon:yes stop_codon:yes gene_type:complete
MNMNSEKILREIADELHNSRDRKKTHFKMHERIDQLSNDKKFIHESLLNCISTKKFFSNATNLFFYLLIEGDVIIAINIFPPNSNNMNDITHDNIHHHGWRLLSTSVISGQGYDTISFKKKSHENRDENRVLLEVEENYTHTKGGTKFLDSEQAHVVFHPKSTAATLAIWSADHPIKTQKIKKMFKRFPMINKYLSYTARSMGLSDLFGLNSTKGNYFHPEGGIIVETRNYSKPHDGSVNEIVPCMFKFFEQIQFNDKKYFDKILNDNTQDVQNLCNNLIQGEPLQDNGISGDARRRFSKNQILDALNYN